MTRTLLKLMFSICLLVAMPFSGAVLRAGVDNWCSCTGSAYVYWESPQWGPFLYLDETGYVIDEWLPNPGPAGVAFCALECYGLGDYWAGQLCDTYSDTEYPNQHYQISFQYYFDDFYNNYGGSGGGGYDTGPFNVLYCD